VPIREQRGMDTATLDYTIAYGKQIILTGMVTNFDLRLRFGAGALQSLIYDERTTVKDSPDRASRGDPTEAGAAASDGTAYGDDGRPTPRTDTAPVILVGLTEEVFFLKRFFVAGELTWYTTTGINGGIDPFFVAQLGGGIRL
jgi:hypothetical protein